MPSTTKQKEETPIFGDALANLGEKDWPKKASKLTVSVPTDKIKKTAKDSGFKSSEGSESSEEGSEKIDKPQEVPVVIEQRRHRTGRNHQLSLKVRDIDKQSFIDTCDEHKLVQGYAFQLMLEMFQQDLANKNPQTSLPLEKG